MPGIPLLIGSPAQVVDATPDEARLIAIVGSVLVLLLLCVIARAVSRRFGLPDAVTLVAVGAVAGLLAERFAPLGALGEMVVTPSVVFFVFVPTLVFNSAFSMDARALRENLAPTLTLAIPGLLLSTTVIGGILYWSVPLFGVSLAWPEALLLGSILSATEPVAVVSMFARVGAPKRLSVLVEGESLFNDATAIALSRVLLGIMATGAVGNPFFHGLTEFLLLFSGGVLVGWALALAAGFVLGAVHGDTLVEITITTLLAYLAFYLGEHTFGVSGVMAVVMAGIVMGGWGRAKISPSVSDYLSDYWEYFAGLANWVIFLLVGLTIDLGSLVDSLPILVWVVGAMFLARALAIYTLLPVANRLTGAEPVDRGYQTVILWGGVRGGIALAIALSLPASVPNRDLLITLTAGAVLVSLITQMFTIERVVRFFRLDQPTLADRLAKLEAQIAARQRALDEIPDLQGGRLFSRTVAAETEERTRRALEREREALAELRAAGLDRAQEQRLLYLRCFAAERHQYYRMLSLGHLSERAYRNLAHSLALQIEAVRHEGRIPEFTLLRASGWRPWRTASWPESRDSGAGWNGFGLVGQPETTRWRGRGTAATSVPWRTCPNWPRTSVPGTRSWRSFGRTTATGTNRRAHASTRPRSSFPSSFRRPSVAWLTGWPSRQERRRSGSASWREPSPKAWPRTCSPTCAASSPACAPASRRSCSWGPTSS